MYMLTQRRMLLMTVLALICVVTVACGPSTPSTSSPTAPSMTTLKVCQINSSMNFFAFYVAQKKGYFKQQGLDIPNPPLLQVGSKVAQAVESGSCDLGNGVMTDVFGWYKTDKNARILGAFLNGYIVDIVVGKGFEQQAHLTASSSLADKVKALKGKKIGITGPGSGTQALVTYLFHTNGMNASTDVTEVSLGSNNTAALASLKAGKVDALSFFSPIGQAAEAQNVGDILISPIRGDIPGLNGDVHGVFYAKQSTIDSKKSALQSYIRAIARAEEFIRSNPAEAKTMVNTYLGLGQNVTDAVYTAVASNVASTPRITEAAYNVAAQFHLQAGLITQIPPFATLISSSTIDSALT